MKRNLIFLAVTFCLSACMLAGCGSRNNGTATQTARPADSSSDSPRASAGGTMTDDTNKNGTDTGRNNSSNDGTVNDNADNKDDNMLNDAGDAVDDAMDGVGDGVKDAMDGAGQAVDDLTR